MLFHYILCKQRCQYFIFLKYITNHQVYTYSPNTKEPPQNSMLRIGDMVHFTTFNVSGTSVANSSLRYSVINDILLFRHATFRLPPNIRNLMSYFVYFCETVQKIKLGTHTQHDDLISLIIPPETLHPRVLRTFFETL
jgi:hypothetical protein